MKSFVGMLVLMAAPVFAQEAPVGVADTLEPVRIIRPGEVITLADVRVVSSDAVGALASPDDAVGMTARRLLVAGRPLMPGDVGPPVLVRRNSQVPILYARGGLTIQTDGRALSDGSEGDRVRVMNLASRQTVTGIVMADGAIAAGVSE